MAPSTHWDDRYSADHYVYGTEPNTFLATAVEPLPPGRALCLGDGEGRNGVHLAGQGFDVTSVDASAVGMSKARALAARRNVAITTVVADLRTYDLGTGSWDLVACIFLHLAPDLRADVHGRIASALAPGGMVVLEAFTPRQLHYRTGGPSSLEMLMTPEMLRNDFSDLEVLHLEEVEREMVEGHGHTGRSAVVQLVARRNA